MARICVIGTRGIPSFVGGIETICENLYPLLVESNPDLEVVVLSRLSHNNVNRYVYKGVNVIVLAAPKISGLETFVHTFFALIYARLFVRPKLVHLHGIGPGFFTPLSRLLGFKTVVTHHAADYKRPKWRWHGKLVLKLGELHAVLFANKVICVSNSVFEELNHRYSFFRRKRLVIRNAGSLILKKTRKSNVNVLSELNLTTKSYILAVGRLDKTKGFDDLIRAFSTAPSSDKKLVIVGSNYIEDSYVASLRKLASENVVFAGTRTGEELASLYQNAALLVNPSYMEGYCLVLAEALSAGTPIIASDIAAHREFELAEQSYFPRGDIAALSRKLKVSDFTIYKSEHAESLQKQNTWSLNAKKHQSLFTTLLKKSP
ncbi:glycosyltransferase family 4 protein [Alteromonas gracilis]|uniref:glycosyltransferase family 4 protein n=1 Tax=Alteromonas gracilis TaxID=1479524 RepID=UPI003736FB2D